MVKLFAKIECVIWLQFFTQVCFKICIGNLSRILPASEHITENRECESIYSKRCLASSAL